MMKTQRRGQGVKQGEARRAAGRREVKGAARPTSRRVEVTLGDVIAAAFDVVGSESTRVAELMGSRAMARAMRRRVVVEG
jgi:hypothetical protein